MMNTWLAYEREVTRAAWKATANVIGPGKQLVSGSVLWVVVTLVTGTWLYQTQGLDSAKDYLVPAAIGAVTVILTWLCWFGFNCVMTPLRIWMRDRTVLRELQAELNGRKAAADVADRLKRAYDHGCEIQRRLQSDDLVGWFTDYRRWYEQTVALLTEVSETERFMFESIVADPCAETFFNSYHIQQRFQLRLDKLRLIIGRCYGRSEGKQDDIDPD